VAETGRGNDRPDPERAPAAPELLRAAMEKVVFFEWRLGEMAAELAAAQSRAAAAELERSRLAEQRSEAEREAEAARQHVHALEAERERLSSLLARPAQAAAEHAAAQAERARSAELAANLAEARREIERQRAERDRWLDERLSQALGSGDSEGSLAAFISELRGEVIALRERQKQSDELLRKAGIAPPSSSSPVPPAAAPRGHALEEARALWPHGRLAAPADPVPTARTATLAQPAASAPRPGAAATALAEQCLRGLAARDPARREQAARHLAAMPVPAAAPALASALGGEPDPRARAQMVIALVACGGPAAADLVVELQSDPEPLVRLSALDALCSLADRAAEALQVAGRDDSPAVRRRAAAIASSLGLEEMRARFAMDAEGSVRAASTLRELPAPAQKPAPVPEPVPARGRSATVRAVPTPPELPDRDLSRDAVVAVQTAIFGMTEAELSEALSLPVSEVPALVASLVSAGRLARRGKRLVAASGPGAAAQGGP
jgi:hypothetical protein